MTSNPLGLPGVRLPGPWTVPGVIPPYSLRCDRERTYLVFGAEEIVATYEVAWYWGPQGMVSRERLAAYEREVLEAIRQHERDRHSRV
jgi:hypothetical protein